MLGDCSASTIFYRELNVVEPMGDREERSLLDAQEKHRIVILESIMSVPAGRDMFLEPLMELAAGGIPDRQVIDGWFWGISEGRLPPDRRDGLRDIVLQLKGPYLNRDAVRRLHPVWHAIEELGEELFAGIDEYRELLRRKSRLMEIMKGSPLPVETLATSFDLLEEELTGEIRRAWRILPGLSMVRNRLDLLELRAGTGIFRYADSGKRFREAMNRLRDVFERFVEANLCLVISRVRRYHPCDVMEEMDLVQEGCQGLMEAVRRFDPSRGLKLSTYAVWWIRQFIMKAIMRHGRLVRLPARMHQEDSAVRRAMDEFALQRGRGPTLEELADFMGRDRQELEDIYLSTAPPLSLDHTDSRQDSTIADFLESRFKTPEKLAIDSEVRELIEEALASLSDREKTIITLRYGLMDNEPSTLEQLGRLFGVSRERVRQLEKRALLKLREHGLISSLRENGA